MACRSRGQRAQHPPRGVGGAADGGACASGAIRGVGPRRAVVARVGLGARRARVLGQVLPGVSVWSVVTPEDEEKLYVVVPGNVGDPSTLVDVLAALGRTA